MKMYRVSNLSEESTGEGTVYHQTWKSDQQKFQNSKYRPNQVVAVETTPGSQPRFERRLFFESVDGGARITDTWKLELSRNPLIQWLGASRVKSAVAENLGKLLTFEI